MTRENFTVDRRGKIINVARHHLAIESLRWLARSRTRALWRYVVLLTTRANGFLEQVDDEQTVTLVVILFLSDSRDLRRKRPAYCGIVRRHTKWGHYGTARS